jgi:membrane protease YdiL (CAAX protease family)
MPLFYNKILRFVTFTLIFPLNQVMRDARPEDANSPVAVWLEPLLVVLGVAAVVRFAPMNSPGYFPVVLTLCAIVFVYALVRFCLCPSLAVRWGLVQGGAYWQYENDEATVYGCQFLGWLWGLSLVPIFILQSQVALPHILNPGGYMVWCAVQDFLFFALLQRNLQDKIPPPFAIGITALLFGLSHYPYTAFMLVTMVIGAVWGWLYYRSRSLIFVTFAHWLLGLVALG